MDSSRRMPRVYGHLNASKSCSLVLRLESRLKVDKAVSQSRSIVGLPAAKCPRHGTRLRIDMGQFGIGNLELGLDGTAKISIFEAVNDQ